MKRTLAQRAWPHANMVVSLATLLTACSSPEGANSQPLPSGPPPAFGGELAPVEQEPMAAAGVEMVGDGQLPGEGLRPRMRLVRMTHGQWENSVQDLLGLEAQPDLSSSFTGDPPQGKFSNNEEALFISPNLRLDYQRAAELLGERIARDPDAVQRLAPTADASAFVRSVGRHAYRRPLAPEEVARYEQLFAAGASHFGSGDDFADGVQLVIEALLQSPYFLFRTELGRSGQPLSGYELVSKLSFLLRDRAPNEALLDRAGAGELDTLDGILALAEELVDSPEAQAAVLDYHRELFGLERYLSIAKDATLFPNYSSEINPELARAEELFLNRLYEGNLGLTELLTSTVAFVNNATEGLYGLSGYGEELQEVDLGPERPGLFTRIGFLAYNGTLRDPDSIHRGVELNREVLCAPLQPPAGVIPALPVIEPGQSNRERVNAHTGPGTCGASCHATLINPIGFAFENFDALGQLRDTDNGKPVDTTGEYAFVDGLKAFSGTPELMNLLADSPQVHACYARHLAEFALGREVDESDDSLLSSLKQRSLQERSSIRDALLTLVTNPAFTHRPTEDQ